MGVIKQEVHEGHLVRFPSEEAVLKPFLTGFDVNWAARRKAYNTELSVYFLGPEPFMSQMFGFEHEIGLFVADYPTLEPRTMQAVDAVLRDDPARGRVEQSVFFLCSPAEDGRQWVSDYSARNPQARIPVVFSATAIAGNDHDQWLVRNVLREQLYSRDLFDYKLPLDNDLFFFGREQIVADHFDAIRRSQNRGLFGLRKTGKTSILYKLKRLVERDGLGAFLYYDCKLPSIRMQEWHELLGRIVHDIATAYGLAKPSGSSKTLHVSDQLIDILRLTPEGKTTALVFDEIEYISPLAIEDTHWHKGFVPFWQTLWAAQSQVRRLSNTVVGVNPTVVERDTINEIQNPMFGVIEPRYLRGLAPEEMRGMLRFFGKRMGFSFAFDAMEYLYERYGGHPLLTRMACSEVHRSLDVNSRQRPVELTRADLRLEEGARDAELTFYCRHVVSELKKFYADEYELLEMLAGGEVSDVMDLSREPEYTRHLKEYGLLKTDSVGKPVFAVPVIGQHIGQDLARKEGRPLVKRIVESQRRINWVNSRVTTIAREIRDLCRTIQCQTLPALCIGSSFPEAERFLGLTPVRSNDQFVVFINICNRCLVESVEQVGRTLKARDYYWTTIKSTYPDYWDALQRVKSYRNNDLHLELTQSAEIELRRFLDQDLEGKRVAQVPDVWFILQQSVLDGLLLGVQCELNRYS